MSAKTERASELILAILVLILFSPFLIELFNITFETNLGYSIDFITGAVKFLIGVFVVVAILGAISRVFES